MPDFQKIRRLGAGNFGEVWLVYDAAVDRNRCVKYVPPFKIIDPSDFYSEPKALIDVKHPNIVEVIDAGREPNGSLYIVMEYLEKGSLDDITNGAPLKSLHKVIKHITETCRGLEYAHNQNYLHRDIKPGNILIGNKGEAKLSDFGLASKVPRDAFGSAQGYYPHMAPECITEDVMTIQTDIYALGMTAYRLLNGDAFLPVPNDYDELIDWIVRGKFPNRTHYRPYVPIQLKKVINKSMHINPAWRYQSARDFRHALESIKIKCFWNWKPKRNCVEYLTEIGDYRIRVVILQNQRSFSITTDKSVNKAKWRRINKDCFSDLSQNQMKSKLRKILARYVSEGK